MKEYDGKKQNKTVWYRHPAVAITLKIGGIALKTLATVLLVILIAGIVLVTTLFVSISVSFDPEKDLPDIYKLNTGQTSRMYVQDEGGNWVEHIALEGAFHEYVKLDDIPMNLRHAVIAIEDERFETHYGVDWKRTIAAVANEILNLTDRFGGSTLTQQTIKNLTGNDDQTFFRKIVEIYGAVYLEKNYHKDEILETYLNVIPLTGQVTGVGYGARLYFGKDVSELTLAECAAMATITKNPSLFDPYNHPENVRDRQHLVLQKMLDLGYITEAEYVQAMNEELVFKSNTKKTDVMDYYTEMVVESVIDDLVAEGYGEREAEMLVYYGGLKIYSYEDVELQRRMEALFADDSLFPEHLEEDEFDPSFAFIALDYEGRVVCTVGDRGEKEGNRVLNLSTDTVRQCGSTIKPIAVYAPAIELNMTYYSERIKDEAVSVLNNKPWPPNYNGTKYGSVTINQALRQSLNTIPAQLLLRITNDYSYNFLTQKLGISTYTESDRNASALALGGASYGTKLSDLVAAYQVFGNGGIYNGYRCYAYVEDNEGSVILSPQADNQQVLSEDTAYVMNQLMQETVYSTEYPPGTLRNLRNDWKKIRMFGKTGTTDANADVLAVGGTPYYIGGAWFGYAESRKEMTYTQAQAVKDLFNEAMKELHKGKGDADFVMPAGVVKETYCKETGLLATDGCKETATGYYRQSNVPGICEKHMADAPVNTTTTGGSTTTAGTTTTTGGSTTTTAGSTTTATEGSTTVADTATTASPAA